MFLNLTGRNDWSSTLPIDNNSYFYPSVSLSFVITDALGIKSDILSFLKVRGSYAEVGGSADAYSLMVSTLLLSHLMVTHHCTILIQFPHWDLNLRERDRKK